MVPDLIVIRETDRLIVRAPGPQGPSGAPGGSYHVHTQDDAAATWVINHNLGVYMGLTLFVGDEVQYADVHQGTPNQTTISFPSPVSGRATFP